MGLGGCCWPRSSSWTEDSLDLELTWNSLEQRGFITHLYDAVPRLVTTGCMEMVVVRLGQHSKAMEIKRNLQHDYASWLNDFLILELG